MEIPAVNQSREISQAPAPVAQPVISETNINVGQTNVAPVTVPRPAPPSATERNMIMARAPPIAAFSLTGQEPGTTNERRMEAAIRHRPAQRQTASTASSSSRSTKNRPSPMQTGSQTPVKLYEARIGLLPCLVRIYPILVTRT